MKTLCFPKGSNTAAAATPRRRGEGRRDRERMASSFSATLTHYCVYLEPKRSGIYLEMACGALAYQVLASQALAASVPDPMASSWPAHCLRHATGDAASQMRSHLQEKANLAGWDRLRPPRVRA